MKVLLLLAISCLALHNGKGAPTKAQYMYVTCNPEGGQANCVTRRTRVMPWTPELPTKLPASAAQYLELEDERAPREDLVEEDEYSIGEEGESPGSSGDYEGSTSEGPFIADQGIVSAASSDTGSGESLPEGDMDMNKGEGTRPRRWLLPRRSMAGQAKPAEQELRDDNLLQL